LCPSLEVVVVELVPSLLTGQTLDALALGQSKSPFQA
uniref:Oxidoreductase n=1 Tax=Haemonchus placei TaxID=6290 RepID=A0A0N4WQM7_HAEPC